MGGGGTTGMLYIVLSHTRPGQVVRLVTTLRRLDPGCFVVVHHDYARSHLDVDAMAALGQTQVIRAPDRMEWGDFSIVAAILRALDWARASIAFDWVTVLSGQDYPARSLKDAEQRLRASGVDGFLDAHDVVAPPYGWTQVAPPGEDLARRYYFRYRRLPSALLRAPRPVRRVARRLALELSARQPFLAVHPMPAGVPWRVGFRRFRTPFSDQLPCRKGWAWFALSDRGVQTLFEVIAEKPGLLRYYRHTILPDESFFQTILFASELKLENESLHYTSWGDASNPHPRLLGFADLQEMLASGAHFGRKFDLSEHPEVLDRLDEHLAGSSAA